MTVEQKNRLKETVERYKTLFSDPDENLTYTTAVFADIQTKTDDPIYSRYYSYPAKLKDEVENQIQDLLKQGIIRSSRSPYNSPIWVVPKKPMHPARKSTE